MDEIDNDLYLNDIGVRNELNVHVDVVYIFHTKQMNIFSQLTTKSGKILSLTKIFSG